MELRKEYAEIAEAHLAGCADHVRERGYAIALACQELADRPPRELTDAEIEREYHNLGMVAPSRLDGVRACIAAFIAKQREPATATVKVRLYRTNSGQPNCVSQVDASLDANFPFGNPTYKWIGEAFEITRETSI